ncbi:DUF4013 domain-containing protein [Methanobrevibacter sp.]|uniref:DUF4013 domain-containing protein n=1 Tax=Methanobrevibacter sp. TaxID=66852 RepID=UPI00388FB680
MIEHTKTFYENIIDSLRFALSDKVSIIVIGVILTLISTMEYYDFGYTGIGIIINIILIILILFESGYSSKIIEETIAGSTKPPAIDNVMEILKLGVKESLVLIGYFMILTALTTLTYIFHWLFPSIEVLIITNIILSAVLLIFLQSSLIYRAHKSGKVREGFDLKGIFRLYSKLGFKSCFYLFVAGLIAQVVIVSSVFNLSSLEFARIIRFILKFTLAPICLIFSLRLFALQGTID